MTPKGEHEGDENTKTNRAGSLLIVLGATGAMVGWRNPTFALLFPAFMVVNAVVFHILPVIVTRIFSPGLITAVALFLPLTAYIYYTAAQDDVLSSQVVWVSSLGGLCLMLFPIALQKTKHNALVIACQGGHDLRSHPHDVRDSN